MRIAEDTTERYVESVVAESSRSMAAVPGIGGGMSLPVPLTPLVGREREIAATINLLHRKDVRLLTLTGPGGVGKTRLALAVAAELDAAFPDGVAFVGLAAIADPELVLPTVARALGLRDAGDEPVEHRLAAFLGGKRCLLILDNVEPVVEAASHLADLLRACPILKLLITSRVRLRLSGERERPVPPLAIAAADDVAPAAIAQSEAVRLFVARTREVDEDFTLTPANAPIVAAICRRVDGLPLAIELAAARIKVLPPAALLARLERRLPLLTGGGRDLPERQRTMRDTIAWSDGLLTAPEQALFRRLGVFVGGFGLDAAEAVTSQAETPRASAFDGVAALVEQSLLHLVTDRDGEPRYAMLETVRDYALDQLAAHGEEGPVRDAHAAWCLLLAERLIPDAPSTEIVPQLGVVETEHANLQAALAWLMSAEETEPFLRLATRLLQFWYHKGLLSEGRQWLEQAVARAEGAPADLDAKALHGAGVLAHFQGDDARAAPLLREALARSRRLDGSWVTAESLLDLGIVEEDQGQYEQAIPLLREALTLFREAGNHTEATVTVCHLGVTAYGMGDFERAVEILEEALALARAANDRYTLPIVLWYLGLLACERGDTARAARCLAEAMTVVEAERDPLGIIYCLACTGVLGAARGQAADAARLLGAAAALRGELGLIERLPERAKYEQAAVIARVALGEDAFAAAWAAGRALPRDQAIAQARRLRRHGVGASPGPPWLDRAGGRRLAPPGRRALRQGNRGGALPQSPHGDAPRHRHPHQAGGREPDRRYPLRRPPQPRLTIRLAAAPLG